MELTVFDLCSELESELGVKFSPEVVASLSHLASDKTRRSAEDLEAFAQHAKRTNVTADDVKLLTRRNPKLVNFPQFLTSSLALFKLKAEVHHLYIVYCVVLHRRHSQASKLVSSDCRIRLLR